MTPLQVRLRRFQFGFRSGNATYGHIAHFPVKCRHFRPDADTSEFTYGQWHSLSILKLLFQRQFGSISSYKLQSPDFSPPTILRVCAVSPISVVFFPYFFQYHLLHSLQYRMTQRLHCLLSAACLMSINFFGSTEFICPWI